MLTINILCVGKIKEKYLKDEESSKTLLQEAMKFEKAGRPKEAEKLYIMAGEPDRAITMYKNIKQYDNISESLIMVYIVSNIFEFVLMLLY